MQNAKVQVKNEKVQDHGTESKEKLNKEEAISSSKQVLSLQKRIEELEQQVKRVLADYQNLEKRSVEERRNLIRSANRDLLLRLLPVLDTLVLASQHVQDKGLQLSIQQFLDVLKNEGVERVETVGKDFDPNSMECVATHEGDEGKVIAEIRAGYTLNDQVLRAAQVTVGKKNVEKEEEEKAKEELHKGDYM